MVKERGGVACVAAYHRVPQVAKETRGLKLNPDLFGFCVDRQWAKQLY